MTTLLKRIITDDYKCVLYDNKKRPGQWLDSKKYQKNCKHCLNLFFTDYHLVKNFDDYTASTFKYKQDMYSSLNRWQNIFVKPLKTVLSATQSIIYITQYTRTSLCIIYLYRVYRKRCVVDHDRTQADTWPTSQGLSVFSTTSRRVLGKARRCIMLFWIKTCQDEEQTYQANLFRNKSDTPELVWKSHKK